MEEGQIVVGLFLPPNEDAAKAVHPRVGALDEPAPRFETRLLLESLGLFPSWASSPPGPLPLLGLFPSGSDVRCEAKFLQQSAHLLVVVAL